MLKKVFLFFSLSFLGKISLTQHVDQFAGQCQTYSPSPAPPKRGDVLKLSAHIWSVYPHPLKNSAQINLGPSSASPLFSIKFQLKPPSRRYYPPGNDHISPLKARLSRWFSFFLFGGICCSLEGISGWTRIIHPNNEIYPRCSEYVDYLPTINSLHAAFWVWIKNYLVTPCWAHAILRVFCLGPFVVSFEKWVQLEPNFCREMYFLHRRPPVEVGSLSHHF